MIRTGKVVKAEGEKLSVCFERPEMCQHCNACGHKQESLVTLHGKALPGDTVEVDMPENQLLRTSFVTYTVPVAALLLGMLLGHLLFGTETALALCGGVALVLSLGLITVYDRYLRKSKHKIPQIISIHHKED